MRKFFLNIRSVFALLLLGQSSTALSKTFYIDRSNAKNHGINFDTVENNFYFEQEIILDWDEVLEVTDEEEGDNYLFSTIDGRSVSVLIEEAKSTAPNKWFR